MDIIEAIKTRKSIRAYKPDPVPRALLEQVLNTAIRAPSAVNSQPWEFVVVTGEVLQKLRQANVERLNAGETVSWDLGRGMTPPALPPTYRERAGALNARLLGLMNIQREERDKRLDWSRKGFRYFDAPAVIIIVMDKGYGAMSYFDIGLVAQSIALAAIGHGLGTCIQGQGVMYSKAVREVLGIPESKNLIIDLAIGYPDWSHPANKLVSDREPLEKIATWVGWREGR